MATELEIAGAHDYFTISWDEESYKIVTELWSRGTFDVTLRLSRRDATKYAEALLAEVAKHG
jgi:hypothetical protein